LVDHIKRGVYRRIGNQRKENIQNRKKGQGKRGRGNAEEVFGEKEKKANEETKFFGTRTMRKEQAKSKGRMEKRRLKIKG
jgi:hypothetical protein